MSVELMPLGVACNSACSYCYQEPIRDGGNASPRGKYDIELMIKQGLSLGSPLTMFGGEALLVPKADLEKVFAASFAKYKRGSIQTNGDLIDAEHIAMFKKYGVGVGVSIDGPGELNCLRPRRSDGNYIEPTQQTMDNLVKLKEAGIGVSIIVTLHKSNAVGENLQTLKEWGLWLSSIGINHVNIHNLESESWLIKTKYGLTKTEEVTAMLDMANWLQEHPELRWAPFHEMQNLLKSESEGASCIWHHCDPMTTPAVQAVLADGSMTNCGRTAKDGVPWVKASQAGFERYLSLYQTPQDLGGCKGCRFFLVCGGSCPGTGFGNDGPDWRLKTDFCSTLMALYTFYEAQSLCRGEIPLSMAPERPAMEKQLMQLFAAGQRPNSLAFLKSNAASTTCQVQTDHGDTYNHADTDHGDAHGDHTDAVDPRHGDAHERDVPHGDIPHGDVHGDSFEATPVKAVTAWKDYKNAN